MVLSLARTHESQPLLIQIAQFQEKYIVSYKRKEEYLIYSPFTSDCLSLIEHFRLSAIKNVITHKDIQVNHKKGMQILYGYSDWSSIKNCIVFTARLITQMRPKSLFQIVRRSYITFLYIQNMFDI